MLIAQILFYFIFEISICLRIRLNLPVGSGIYHFSQTSVYEAVLPHGLKCPFQWSNLAAFTNWGEYRFPALDPYVERETAK